MDGIDAYVLAKNIAVSAVSGVKNYTVDGTTLKIETNDGNVLEMVFPVPTGIEPGYYNDENGKFYRDSEFENEIIGKTNVVYIDHGQNRLCLWNGTEFTATKKNALEFTAEEKAKLERLRNYDDSVLSGKINNIEKVIPTNASASNKLATIADVENKNDGTTNYNDLENKPKIAGVALSGNKSLADLGIQPAITGKGLSTEDFTTEEKTKLSSLSNYNDSSIKSELTNIKNIIPSNANSENKLATLADIPSGGSGNEGGTTNYSELTNKPQIAGVTLSGNKSLADLGIQGAEEGKGLSTNDFSNEDKSKLDNLSNYDDTSLKGRMSNIENKIPSKASSSNKLATMADIPSVPEIPEVITDYSDLNNKPQIGGVTLDGNKNLADLGIQAIEEGKGLSTEDFTTEEKNKLAELVNYNDSELDTRISSIEEVMPTSATSSNPLATLADIPSNVSGGSSTPTNYATLSNKPQIAGVELTGNKTLANLGIQPSEEGKGLSTNDFTNEDKEKLAGLVNYDDSALDNRVSDVENALSNKVNKDGSKGLSTNDFSNEDKAKLDELSNYDDSTLVGRVSDLENDLSSKVDKDGDKVLSTNDFTNAYKNKLDNLSNYDDTGLSERITDIENIIPNDVSAENKLVTMSDIGNTSVITPLDIDRLWEMELEDGDKEGY